MFSRVLRILTVYCCQHYSANTQIPRYGYKHWTFEQEKTKSRLNSHHQSDPTKIYVIHEFVILNYLYVIAFLFL